LNPVPFSIQNKLNILSQVIRKIFTENKIQGNYQRFDYKDFTSFTKYEYLDTLKNALGDNERFPLSVDTLTIVDNLLFNIGCVCSDLTSCLPDKCQIDINNTAKLLFDNKWRFLDVEKSGKVTYIDASLIKITNRITIYAEYL
jgi:hypothetical protein